MIVLQLQLRLMIAYGYNETVPSVRSVATYLAGLLSADDPSLEGESSNATKTFMSGFVDGPTRSIMMYFSVAPRQFAIFYEGQFAFLALSSTLYISVLGTRLLPYSPHPASFLIPICMVMLFFVAPFVSSSVGLVGIPIIYLDLGYHMVCSFRNEVIRGVRKSYELKRKRSKKKIRLVRQISVPNEWEDFDESDPSAKTRLVEIPKSHPDAARAIAAFKKTGGPGTVLQVFQVQAPELWFRYAHCRSEMSGNAEEVWVWHGCSKQSAESIVGNGTKSEGGFDWRFCGAHGTYYGKGAYFALNASYSCSSTYSSPDENGVKRVFYARASVDKSDVVKGSSSLNTPPGKWTVATDNLSYPKMYVLFNARQSYPAYLLTWK